MGGAKGTKTELMTCIYCLKIYKKNDLLAKKIPLLKNEKGKLDLNYHIHPIPCKLVDGPVFAKSCKGR